MFNIIDKLSNGTKRILILMFSLFFKLFRCNKFPKFASGDYRKPVVIFCFRVFHNGGAENFINSICKHISKDFHIIFIVDDKISSYIVNDYKVICLSEFSKNKFVQSAIIRELMNVSCCRLVVNVNSNSFFRLFLSDLINTERIKIIFVLFSRYNFIHLNKVTIKKLYSLSYKIISDNKRVLFDLRDEFSDVVNVSKNICLYNVVKFAFDEDLFSSVNYSAIRNLQGNEIKLLWAGRIDKDKNIELLIEFAKKYPNFKICVYGSCMLDNSLINLLFTCSNIEYLGEFNSLKGIIVSNHEFSAFMFTSYWEGMPNILLEVGTLGLPIIAPNVGGVCELINDNTGYLVGNNVDSYYQALYEMQSNVDLVIIRSRNLASHICLNHSVKVYSRKINDVFMCIKK